MFLNKNNYCFNLIVIKLPNIWKYTFNDEVDRTKDREPQIWLV